MELTHGQSSNLLKHHFIPTFSNDVLGATLLLMLAPEMSVPSPGCVRLFQSNTPKTHKCHRWDRRDRPSPNDCLLMICLIMIYINSSGNGQSSSNKWCKFLVISGSLSRLERVFVGHIWSKMPGTRGGISANNNLYQFNWNCTELIK
jgi:hypothetical protein